MATGRDMITLAERHIGEKYVLGASCPKENPNLTGPWDCAEFISWCVFQTSRIFVGCRGANHDAYTGYWNEDKATLCRIISIDEAAFTVGAILLRVPNPGIRMGHIVFSDGNGGTVEAMGKDFGVRRGEIQDRLWHFGLLVNGVDYTQNTITFNYQVPTNNFLLKNPVMEADIVLAAKKALKRARINPGTMDRRYDSDMQSAIYNYQIMKGLVVDGIMGKQTLKALRLIE